MITYKKLGLRFAEFHYNDESRPVSGDVVRHLWRLSPLRDFRCEESFTLVLDLHEDPDGLLRYMHRNARQGIRRAEKDAFWYETLSARHPGALTEFCRFYDGFARSKRLPCADRDRLKSLAQDQVLDLSRVTDHSGRVFTWHAHYRGIDRARLIYSASIRRATTDTSLNALIGRANCWHTWHDILRFQRHGIKSYDFGGWYAGTQDREKLRINRFKESFGGKVVREFRAEVALTFAGRLAMALKYMRMNFSAWARFQRADRSSPWRGADRNPLRRPTG